MASARALRTPRETSLCLCFQCAAMNYSPLYNPSTHPPSFSTDTLWDCMMFNTLWDSLICCEMMWCVTSFKFYVMYGRLWDVMWCMADWQMICDVWQTDRWFVMCDRLTDDMWCIADSQMICDVWQTVRWYVCLADCEMICMADWQM